MFGLFGLFGALLLACTVPALEITITGPATVDLFTPFVVEWSNSAGSVDGDVLRLYSCTLVNGQRVAPMLVNTSASLMPGATHGYVILAANGYGGGVAFASYESEQHTLATSADMSLSLEEYTLKTGSDGPMPFGRPFDIYWTAPAMHSVADTIVVNQCYKNGELLTNPFTLKVQRPSATSGSVQIVVVGYKASPGTYVAQYRLAGTKTTVAETWFTVEALDYSISIAPASEPIMPWMAFSVTWRAPVNHTVQPITDTIRLMPLGGWGFTDDSEAVQSVGQTSGVVLLRATQAGPFVLQYLTWINIRGFYGDWVLYQSPVFNVSAYDSPSALLRITAPPLVAVNVPFNVTWAFPRSARPPSNTILTLWMVLPDEQLLDLRQPFRITDGWTGQASFIARAPGRFVVQSDIPGYPSTTALSASCQNYSVGFVSTPQSGVQFQVWWNSPAAANYDGDDKLRLVKVEAMSNTIIAEGTVNGLYNKRRSFLLQDAGVFMVEYLVHSLPRPYSGDASNWFVVAARSESVTVSGVATYALTKLPTQALLWTPFSVSWKAPAGHDARDSLNLYLLSELGAMSFYAYREVGAASSGSVSFSVGTPGQYMARYTGRSDVVIDSAPFTVSATNYALKLAQPVYALGSTLALKWQAPYAHNSDDYIRLWRCKTTTTTTGLSPPPGQMPVCTQASADVFKVPANMSYDTLLVPMTEPLQLGYFEYNARQSRSNPPPVALSANFSVVSQVSLSVANATVHADEPFLMFWNAPNGHRWYDRIVLFEQNPLTLVLTRGREEAIQGEDGATHGNVSVRVSHPGTYACGYELLGDPTNELVYLTPFFEAVWLPEPQASVVT